MDAADDVVMSGVNIGLLLADFGEALVLRAGLSGGGEFLMSRDEAWEEGGNVGGGENGLVRGGG